MAEDRIFDVQARIASILQQDISKVKGKVNLHTYLGLDILSSRNLMEPSRGLSAKRVNMSRPAEDADKDLSAGDTIRIELGVDRLENPSVYHWMRRVE